MSERTLFDAEPDPPAQRHSATSCAAARSMVAKAPGERARYLSWLVLRGDRGATDEEAQTELRMGASTQRPRRIECVRAGQVADSGKKRLTTAGRWAVVWVAILDKKEG